MFRTVHVHDLCLTVMTFAIRLKFFGHDVDLEVVVVGSVSWRRRLSVSSSFRLSQ